MARYTVIENDERFAKITEEGNTYSVYIMDGPPESTRNFSKAARGFTSEVAAARWAHKYITTV